MSSDALLCLQRHSVYYHGVLNKPQNIHIWEAEHVFSLGVFETKLANTGECGMGRVHNDKITSGTDKSVYRGLNFIPRWSTKKKKTAHDKWHYLYRQKNEHNKIWGNY